MNQCFDVSVRTMSRQGSFAYWQMLISILSRACAVPVFIIPYHFSNCCYSIHSMFHNRTLRILLFGIYYTLKWCSEISVTRLQGYVEHRQGFCWPPPICASSGAGKLFPLNTDSIYIAGDLLSVYSTSACNGH